MITLDNRNKIILIAAVTALTTAIHYGIVLEPIFGDRHWIHAVHTRFCYVPIVIAASWFGLRGGLWTAAAISIIVLPYIFGSQLSEHNLASELVEIVFYFALGTLIGGLIDRENATRRHREVMRSELERSERLSMVGQIAAGVAHELKNPLASIKGAVEIIGDDSTSEADRREFRDILFREIKRIDGTVSEFLEFARPREARMEILDISELLRGTLRQVEPQASERQITFRENIAERVTLNGDRDKLHEMILNLILNAIQASPAGSAIDISLDIAADRIELAIKDYGEGIAPEIRGRVFEPFFTTRASGTGLGLPIAQSIAKLHGGEIAVAAGGDNGALIHVTLPRADHRS